MTTLNKTLQAEKANLEARLKAIDFLMGSVSPNEKTSVVVHSDNKKITRNVIHRAGKATMKKRVEFIRAYLSTVNSATIANIHKAVRREGFKCSKAAISTGMRNIKGVQYNPVTASWKMVGAVPVSRTVQTVGDIPNKVKDYVSALSPGQNFTLNSIRSTYKIKSKSDYNQLCWVVKSLSDRKEVAKIDRGIWKKAA